MTRAAALAWISLAASGQTPSFEAASVKPAAPRTGRGGRSTASGDQFTYANTTLLNILARAYLVRGFQVEGPPWIRTERYDIIAKAPENTPKDQVPRMLQKLIAERFAITLHRERRAMPVYVLFAERGERRFKESQGELSYGMSNGRRELKNHSMAQLSDFLSSIVQRLVLDQTGLTGTYNFPLEMSIEELGGFSAKPDASAPSIFTIVESLGLKLESRKAPVDVIVIDDGNKIPTEN